MAQNKSQVFYNEKRQPLQLGALIKSGGAGSVYHLASQPGSVAKIYHDSIDKALYQRKIQAMLQHVPDIPPIALAEDSLVQLAWPTSPLLNTRGEFVGFVMPELDVKRSIELEYILQPRQAEAAKLPDGIGVKVSLATNLCTLVAALHQQQHRIIDMKPVNLRFYRESLYVALLDCDGFSIEGGGERFPAGQFTAEYLAPEFQKTGKVPEKQEEWQDRFALAVILFQLLNFGLHPYSGRPQSSKIATDLPGRIAAGCYAYGLTANKLMAPAPVSMHTLLPNDLRLMFDKAFGPLAASRPSAREWASVLRPYALPAQKKIVVCKANKRHQHFAGLACPECTRKKQMQKALQAARSAKRQAPQRQVAPAYVPPPRPAPTPPPPSFKLTMPAFVPGVVLHTAFAVLLPLVFAWLFSQFASLTSLQIGLSTFLSMPWKDQWFMGVRSIIYCSIALVLVLVFKWAFSSIVRSKP
ncbi:DNA-binding protein [Serratia fonticola]|jgi:DNA-binding helix-hairpin-helix protein with protein kinase domain|uniref:DNA-binding protein n=1 Tax=Serratia fonticola TaxID=47917 RepID=UPI000403C8CF|nr:DNA-binding protein [Serratia fonticola]AKG69639.1 DNA-binding protein [Serratia fonticola]CAI0701569.1 Uncharacterized protein with protein kinase and helix-hairpin-helix DNA-binding domains [Serratia fonticola]CAI1040926.1 Uncharacterized protein with protein kinase and helix-hairpin-helix DNA-binding domains [Serratia fonticola]CAI1096098.1 Uncharacterized protein with protein kinase and helix-hairpin-helix DNA-binding domains [Serratia fonticola]CAI1629540.1 Uncharacterized protein with